MAAAVVMVWISATLSGVLVPATATATATATAAGREHTDLVPKLHW